MNDRLNRQVWLDAGLVSLATDGIEGLRIMPIAERLGVTKGSFYWHFRDLNAFRAALLTHWEETGTQHIIDQVESIGGDALAKLRTLMGITVASNARLALTIRAWAGTDVQVAKVVKRVDKKRLAYATELIEGLGWSPDDAVTLARWTYGALIGYFTLDGPAVTSRQIDLILSTLTVVPPGRPR